MSGEKTDEPAIGEPLKRARPYGKRLKASVAGDPKDVMTTEEVAEYLSLGVRTITNLAGCGDIPATKIARRWRFSRRALDRWLEYSALAETSAGFQYFYRNLPHKVTEAGVKSCLRENYKTLAMMPKPPHNPNEPNYVKRYRERLEREALKKEERKRAKEEKAKRDVEEKK